MLGRALVEPLIALSIACVAIEHLVTDGAEAVAASDERLTNLGWEV